MAELYKNENSYKLGDIRLLVRLREDITATEDMISAYS